MNLFDTLFGTDDERKALTNRTYLGPQSMLSDADKSIRGRMMLQSQLGGAAQAVANANQKGMGIGGLLAALGGGLTQGTTDFDKMREQAATGEARARTAAGLPIGGTISTSGTGGATGRVGMGGDGQIYEIMMDGTAHPLPVAKQKGYAGQKIPSIDDVRRELGLPNPATRLNPNMSTIQSTGGMPDTGGAGASMPSISGPNDPKYAALPIGGKYTRPDKPGQIFTKTP